MPTHLLLEGEDIESVLARLRDDHGPDAKIVQAELVRSGGFAGFFAKRRYEVTVEVDDEALAGSDGRHDDRFGSPYEPTFEPRPLASAPLETPTGTPTGTPSGTPAGPAMATQTTATTPAPATTSAPALDLLLDAAEGGDQAEFGGRLMTENDRAATPFVPMVPGWHRPVSTEGAAFSDVLTSLTQNLAEQRHVRPMVDALVPEPRRSVDTVDAADSVETIGSVGTDPVTTAGPLTTASGTENAVQADPVPPVAAPPAEPVFERMVRDLGRCREELAAIGVPAPLLAKIVSSEPLLALRDLVDAADEPRRPQWTRSATRGGALVVVVGSWAVAERTVRGLVGELAVDEDAILAVGTAVGDALPAGQSVRSHAAAVQLVRQARQSHEVSVLVIDPGTGRHSADRVAELVATLEPQHVLVATAAGADMAAGLAAVDALANAAIDVDGLALDGVAGSSTPAAAFEIPLPVSWIDGQFATTGRWIGLLVDAMTRAGGHRC